eukprot:7268059-Pyramimonas_sp.AAC.1
MAEIHLFFGKPVACSHFLVALSVPLFSSCVAVERAAFSRFPGLPLSFSTRCPPHLGPWELSADDVD